MSAAARHSHIEPALIGTRYGAALEGAARDIQTCRLREAKDIAAWHASHPECRINALILREALRGEDDRPELELYEHKHAPTWAAALDRMLDGGWHRLPGNNRTMRLKLINMTWATAKGTSMGRRFQITELGIEWLENYKDFHHQKALLTQQIKEGVRGGN